MMLTQIDILKISGLYEISTKENIMASVMEALENAEYNLTSGFGTKIALSQLRNAIALLQKGYSIDDDIEEIVSEYGDIDKAPNR